MNLYYFYTVKALWDGQGKIKMHYGMSRVRRLERVQTFQEGDSSNRQKMHGCFLCFS